MHECFHCLHKSVVWDADFDSSDYGFEEEGIIQNLHCCNCGARIQYFVPTIRKEDMNGNT